MRHLILILFVVLSCSLRSSENEIRVMSYNIRYHAPEDYNNGNGWNDRKERLVQFFKFHSPPIIGMQEVVVDQLEFIDQNLSNYDYVGVGRNDGKNAGEHTPIFYDKNKFELLENDDFWLSETPDVPSKSWDAALNRVATYAKLKDIETGEKFFILNTHFDHKGEIARIRSSELIVKKINELAKDLPVIFMGDLNTLPGSEAYNNIENFLNDAFLITKEPTYGPIGTSSGFEVCADKILRRIDYIFVNDKIEVLNHSHLTDSYYKKYHSDHLPVLSKIKIK
jgi:endonuclease/exonuclease/phosphatase family metal-dependent hydrolase